MGKRFGVKKHRYVLKDRKVTRTVFHPVVYSDIDGVCEYLGDERTLSGLVEYDDRKSALRAAESYYDVYLARKKVVWEESKLK